ncbi:MAG: HEAT repeat domain-containing protein [Frankiales bacterium]|nr:HEAT repeat domain-containing protein [Frankiales bacterium]
MSAKLDTPRSRIELLCRRHGAPEVADACIRLIAGHDLDPLMRAVFGNAHTDAWLGSEVNAYWLRVWGVRGLLWNWDERATSTLQSALTDEAWRVREMAAKVVSRHYIDPALPFVVDLRGDPVARVRQAAERALIRLTTEGG